MRFLIAAAVVVIPVAAQAGPATTAVMQPIAKFVAALNADDERAAAATMTASQSITDEFAPFHWEGATALATWFTADAADAASHGVTGGMISIADPLHVTISGEFAYAVVPMTYAYTVHGAKTVEKAVFTASLQHSGAGWRMSSWSYGLQ